MFSIGPQTSTMPELMPFKVHLKSLISVLIFVAVSHAANFIDYDPQPGVQEEFKPFFQA